eukprot:TRINITY_DN29149_c0_g1_i1.p1 TRINITY_DN29149_c0_g1~~TRINITY_DN29149_c0_g1_i1.p1  ORF type:complete len:227 (-),score=39.40 TRINITY_DN29149_c0_g1_i1:97-777(-)
MDENLETWLAAGSSCATGVADLGQRVVIMLADVFLIGMALSAVHKDWYHHCDETLHFYAFMCIVLSLLDVVFELVRCSMESQLDRLQRDFRPEANTPAATGNDSLLADGEAPVRHSQASLTASSLGQSIRREKAMKQRRTSDLHFWSIVFSCLVAIIFSFFSGEDEECAEHVPALYKYIRVFTYVYIFRLGVMLLLVCCRTVKNYEDAAGAAGAMKAQAPQQMRSF